MSINNVRDVKYTCKESSFKSSDQVIREALEDLFKFGGYDDIEKLYGVINGKDIDLAKLKELARDEGFKFGVWVDRWSNRDALYRALLKMFPQEQVKDGINPADLKNVAKKYGYMSYCPSKVPFAKWKQYNENALKAAEAELTNTPLTENLELFNPSSLGIPVDSNSPILKLTPEEKTPEIKSPQAKEYQGKIGSWKVTFIGLGAKDERGDGKEERVIAFLDKLALEQPAVVASYLQKNNAKINLNDIIDKLGGNFKYARNELIPWTAWETQNKNTLLRTIKNMLPVQQTSGSESASIVDGTKVIKVTGNPGGVSPSTYGGVALLVPRGKAKTSADGGLMILSYNRSGSIFLNCPEKNIKQITVIRANATNIYQKDGGYVNDTTSTSVLKFTAKEDKGKFKYSFSFDQFGKIKSPERVLFRIEAYDHEIIECAAILYPDKTFEFKSGVTQAQAPVHVDIK